MTSAKAFGERAGPSGGTAYALTSCLVGLSKLDEATKLLEGVDTKVVAQLTRDPNLGPNGEYAAARKLTESATPVFSRSDAEPSQQRKLRNAGRGDG